VAAAAWFTEGLQPIEGREEIRVSAPSDRLHQSMRKAVHPLTGGEHEDYEPLLELIGELALCC
jgi:hypothetical protein